MDQKDVAGGGAEWVGGIVSLPTYVNGADAPFRPEAILWMIPGGGLLGMDTGLPGDGLARAAESFKKAVTAPLFGPAHAPTRIRVASRELAEQLREVAHPAEVVCGPTPELERFLRTMRERMAGRDFGAPSYLSETKTVRAVAGFFRATASLYRCAPWTVVPDDTKLLTVTIPALGVERAAVSIIGQSGGRFGLILFSSMQDFEACLDGAEAFGRGEEPEMPAHLALNFESKGELRAELQKEIATLSLELAGESAAPWLVSVDKDLIARPPTARELSVVEALASAIPPLFDERISLLAAWESGSPFSRTLRVVTASGPVDVTIGA